MGEAFCAHFMHMGNVSFQIDLNKPCPRIPLICLWICPLDSGQCLVFQYFFLLLARGLLVGMRRIPLATSKQKSDRPIVPSLPTSNQEY